MAAAAVSKPALRLVSHDPETGEINGCEACRERQDEILALQRALGDANRREAQLKRDREKEAREHELWPVIAELFKLWKAETGHSRSKFGRGRFELALPLVKLYGQEISEMAIKGIARQPYVNRAGEKFDGWETVFKDEGSMERYANKCPRDLWSESYMNRRRKAAKVARGEQATLEGT